MPNAVSTIQASSTAAPQGSSNQHNSNSNAGLIAGAVVGGVVGAALLTALILWYRRRRRLHMRPRPSPFAEKEEVSGFSDPGTSMSTGKYYVRAIAPGTRLSYVSLLCGCFDELCRVIFRTHPTRVRSRNRSYHRRRVCSKPLQVPITSMVVGRFVHQTGPGIQACRLFDLMMSSQICQSSVNFDTRHGQ